MTMRRIIQGTEFTTRAIDGTGRERAIYSPEDQYLGTVVKVATGWGTMDRRDWASLRDAAEYLSGKAAKRAAKAAANPFPTPGFIYTR